MVHKQLNSKADFDDALNTEGKYVLIYAYDQGDVPAAVEEKAESHAETTDAFAVQVGKYETAKKFFNISNIPAVLVFKDGKEVKRVDDMSNTEEMKELVQLLA